MDGNENYVLIIGFIRWGDIRPCSDRLERQVDCLKIV